MDNKPTLCLLCDGVMSAVERYEKHLRIDHRVVCRVNWIIENTAKAASVDVKKEVEESTNVEDESGENVAEVKEFIEEAISNGSLDAYENSIEEKNDDETLIDESFDLNDDSKIKMKKLLKIEERKMNKKLKNKESKIQKNVNCKLCKKEFKSKLGLKGHLKRKHPKNVELVEETVNNIKSKDYVNSVKYESQSEVIDSTFRLPPTLIINPRSNLSKSNVGYGCSLCPDRVFKGKDKVKRHLKIHISKEDRDKVLCLECNQGFLNSDFLKEHMKLCEGLKELYFCPEISCEVRIENSQDLKEHKKTHRLDTISNKQFFCDACGQVFKRSDHLKRHSAGHSDNQYACDSCEKVFKRMDQVRRHSLAHTNTKFSCETCLKTFARKYRMMAHQKSAHEIK